MERRGSPRASRSAFVRGNASVAPFTPHRSPSAKPGPRIALPTVASGTATSGTMIPAAGLPSPSRLGTNSGYCSALSVGGRTEKSRTPSVLITALYGRSGMAGYCSPCRATVTAVPSATDGARVGGGASPSRTHRTIASNAAR